MKKIVQENKIGVVCETFDPQDMAVEIQKLDIKNIHKCKINSDKCSLRYSTGYYENILLNAFGKL